MTPPRPRVVLASASAGRLALLRTSGITASVIVSTVDERAVAGASGLAGHDAPGITTLLARAKAGEVAGRIMAGALGADAPPALGDPPEPDRPVLVIGADSMLALDGQLWGKARDADEVRARWARYTASPDTWAELVTGHAVIELPSGREVVRAVGTRIRMATPTQAELEDYIASGEPLAVAGSATIDGLGAPFLAGIVGDPSNVIGLSLPGLRLMLAELGHAWTSLWDRPAKIC